MNENLSPWAENTCNHNNKFFFSSSSDGSHEYETNVKAKIVLHFMKLFTESNMGN